MNLNVYKKIIFTLMLFLTVSFPFLHALFTPKMYLKTKFDNPERQVLVVFDKMKYTAYHRLNDGSSAITHGFYGVLNNTYYLFFLDRRYAALDKEKAHVVKKVLQKGFLTLDNRILVLKLKNISDTNTANVEERINAIARYYYALSNDDSYYYKKAMVKVE